MTLQQFSGPVMAKGVEDTAFYRFNRFVALNEVGGAPERFGIAAIRASQGERGARSSIGPMRCWRRRPTTPSAAKTIGPDWRSYRNCRTNGAGASRPGAASCARDAAMWRALAAPDRIDEYMLYQMLVGSWPMDMLEDPGAEQLKAYGARIHSALEKSLREAKRRSSWAAPNAEYEEATQAFAREALRSDAFLSNFLPFVQRVARLGVQNSLAQTRWKTDRAGRAGHLSGLRAVGPQSRRPRQSTAGRFRAPRSGDGGAHAPSRGPGGASLAVQDADARMAGRPGEAGDDRAAARSPPQGAGALQLWRLSADRHRRRSIRLGLRLRSRPWRASG